MIQYCDILKKILKEGTPCDDRTGVGTLSIFGHQSHYFLDRNAPGAIEHEIRSGQAAGFPIVTTKKVHLRSIIHELLWFLQGDTNIAALKEHNVKIWDAWADENGDLGPIYGHQWRSWACPDGSTLDQITELIKGIKTNPYSRRHIVTAWNPAQIDEMALPPATACSSSMWPAPQTLARIGSRASSTSVRRICSWGCRSISPPTPCSPRWSPR